jgi:CubicO group peptidase (beta-lactamase class C family)
VRVALVFLFASWGVARAQETAAPPPRPELTPADVEAFLDGLVPYQIEANDIAGATIAVVKDGKLFFAKGYGAADVKTKAPVTSETMFRIGSITKLFTWTAVMQQVEEGKLDLDADINLYLDFKIPQKFGKPVTLRHLMTHRGGFQDAIKGLGAQNSGKVDLQTYVRENRPDQIFEPGTTPSYSNYGTALAGYLVERVSNMPFDTYLEERIYAPLGMLSTSIRQPLPKDLEAFMSTGYNLASGEPVPFEIVNGYPAGSQASSALDMANFMLAHLSAGKFGEAQLLKPQTVTLMHDTVTAVDPRQNGIALGFYEANRNGMRIISHGGDTIAFHSDLHLIPSQGLGFFVSYNSTVATRRRARACGASSSTAISPSPRPPPSPRAA